MSSEVGVKIVVDGSQRVEDNAKGNQERKNEHF